MDFIFNDLNSWGSWLYTVLGAAMIIDGNITVLVIGFLASAGVVNPLLGIITAIIGGLAEQVLLFWLGVKLRGNNSLALVWFAQAGSQFDKHFQRRPRLSLFITKFIYGIHRSSLVRVAVLGVPLRKFLKISIPVLIYWVLILFFVGFSISKPMFILLKDYIHYLEYGLLGLLITIILLERYVLSGKLNKLWQKI